MSKKTQLDATPFDLIKEDQLVPGTKRSQHLSPDFSIFLSNGDQLTIKLQELRSLLYQKDYDLVLLTEVCPMNPRTRLEDSYINMPGYQVVTNLSCTGCKSSVLALIKNTHAVYGLSSVTNSAPTESIWFDFTGEDQHQRSLRVGCTYWSLFSLSAIETENTFINVPSSYWKLYRRFYYWRWL